MSSRHGNLQSDNLYEHIFIQGITNLTSCNEYYSGYFNSHCNIQPVFAFFVPKLAKKGNLRRSRPSLLEEYITFNIETFLSKKMLH